MSGKRGTKRIFIGFLPQQVCIFRWWIKARTDKCLWSPISGKFQMIFSGFVRICGWQGTLAKLNAIFVLLTILVLVDRASLWRRMHRLLWIVGRRKEGQERWEVKNGWNFNSWKHAFYEPMRGCTSTDWHLVQSEIPATHTYTARLPMLW